MSYPSGGPGWHGQSDNPWRSRRWPARLGIVIALAVVLGYTAWSENWLASSPLPAQAAQHWAQVQAWLAARSEWVTEQGERLWARLASESQPAPVAEPSSPESTDRESSEPRPADAIVAQAPPPATANEPPAVATTAPPPAAANETPPVATTAPPAAAAGDAAAAVAAAPQATVDSAPDAKADLRNIAAWCQAITGRLASVPASACDAGEFQATGYYSVQGWPIALKHIAAQGKPRGRVLLIGGTHGDELTSVSLTFWWLDALERHGSAFEWHVVPAMNPDGVLAEPARRVNAHGVDLNRNLPTADWADASHAYWIDVNRSARRFPGTEAASEPETRWLVAEIARFDPDVIVSLHAPLGVLDYDGHLPPPPALGHLPLDPLGVYPGSLGNYAARHLDIPVMTVELAHAWAMPSHAQASAMWRDLAAWLQHSVGGVRQAQAKPLPGSQENL